jgi:hypothetical protein
MSAERTAAAPAVAASEPQRAAPSASPSRQDTDPVLTRTKSNTGWPPSACAVASARANRARHPSRPIQRESSSDTPAHTRSGESTVSDRGGPEPSRVRSRIASSRAAALAGDATRRTSKGYPDSRRRWMEPQDISPRALLALPLSPLRFTRFAYGSVHPATCAQRAIPARGRGRRRVR